LAATGAFAQSSVQIDGIMDAGFQAIDYKGNKVNGIGGNGSSTSQINFRGTEDLGSGLKAEFRVETDWNAVSNNANTGAKKADGTVAAASTFGNGEIRVGLASNVFGRVDLGVVNYNTLTTFTTGQPFGTAIGSGFRAVALTDTQGITTGLTATGDYNYNGMGGSQVRSDNSIKYTSPTFYGFNGSLYKAFKQTKAVNNNFSTTLGAYDMQGTEELGLGYANGPLAVSFSNLKQDYSGVAMNAATPALENNIKATVNTLGANYAFGPAKVYGLYQNTKMDGGAGAFKADYWALSGTYQLGSVVLMASYGELKDKSDGASKDKAKLTALGADYNLSKRTAVYARYEQIRDQAGFMPAAAFAAVSSTTGDTRSRTAIGVRHAF
jgi:predicted porin